MRTFKFVPEATKDQIMTDEEGKPVPHGEAGPILLTARFSGHIILRVPDFDERMQLLEDIGLEINDAGQGAIPEDNKLKVMRRLVKATQAYYKEVDMKHVDGTEYKSFEDLSFDLQAQPILMEVAKLMQEGIRPGKN